MKTIITSAFLLSMALQSFATNFTQNENKDHGSLSANFNQPGVKFYSFDASASGSTVICNWATLEEINNNYFQLERSLDGINYNMVALIFGQENNTSTKETYKYKDHASILQDKNVVYYRLVQVDKDGSTSYSKAITVKLK